MRTWVRRPGCLGCAKCRPEFICSISKHRCLGMDMKYQHYTAAAGRWRWAFRLVRHLTGSSTHSLDPHWTDAERCSLSFFPSFLFFSSRDPDCSAFTSHAHPVQTFSQTQEVCMASVSFTGDWTRSWIELNAMHRIYSSLGVYHIDLLFWCFVSLYSASQLYLEVCWCFVVPACLLSCSLGGVAFLNCWHLLS